MHKVYVLLSGGVDSSTTLAMARRDFPNDQIETYTIDYGQRHLKEAECALKQADAFMAVHRVIPIHGLLSGMLVDKGDNNETIPNVSYAELPHGISPTYVSFRNGMMLSILAAQAQGWIMEQEKLWERDFQRDTHGDYGEYAGARNCTATIYCGIHADDAANDAYPDCTLEFIGAMANAIQVGTYGKVRVRAPLVHMEKSAVIREGTRLGVDYSETWSCYAGEKEHCSVCPTCRARKQAFEDANVVDPTIYAA